MSRRHFVQTLAVGGLSAALGACKSKISSTSHSSKPGKTFRWKMVTTWAPHFPVLGLGAEHFAKRVAEASDGQMQISVYGAGELVPALEVFSAVQQGSAEMGHGAAYYWAGKLPSAVFFTSVPFGLTAQQMNTWMYMDDGLKLWQELYNPHGLLPMPCGNTGVQMGGWFNREISTMADIKGLKMRIPGIGGQVWSKAGGTAILSAGGEIYTNLERGVIDGAEWVGPYHDSLMGFQKIAKYYYHPGWQEPGSVLELLINLKKWNELPTYLQKIIEMAAAESNVSILSDFESQNSIYLNKLREEKVDIRSFPVEVLAGLKKHSVEVLEEIAAKDAFAHKAYTSFKQFASRIGSWNAMGEIPMMQLHQQV